MYNVYSNNLKLLANLNEYGGLNTLSAKPKSVSSVTSINSMTSAQKYSQNLDENISQNDIPQEQRDSKTGLSCIRKLAQMHNQAA